MKKVNLEKLSQYAILLVALLALFVSIWQIRVTHEHNQLTVQPYLDYHIEQTDSTLAVEFSNEGFGPAIIKSITYESGGKTYTSLETYLNESGEVKNRIGSYQYSENTIVARGQRKLLLRLRNRKTRGVHVTITYESVYEDLKKFYFSF